MLWRFIGFYLRGSSVWEPLVRDRKQGLKKQISRLLCFCVDSLFCRLQHNSSEGQNRWALLYRFLCGSSKMRDHMLSMDSHWFSEPELTKNWMSQLTDPSS